MQRQTISYDEPTQPVQYVFEAPGGQPERRRGCLGGCLPRLLLLGMLLLTFLVVTGATIAGTLIYTQFSREIEEGIAKLDQAHDRESFETTRITDRNGRLLWEIFGEGKRTRIPLQQMPDALVQATIAVEDDTFYQNDGLDFPALIAALVANLRQPEGRPAGASTITQQLVRHIVFPYEERVAVDYNRKSKEIILAYIMSRKFSKDEILELYLNEIYYGNLAYGVEAAAQTYFRKPATDLNLAESSLLAGLPQSPVELDPLANLELARQRQWLVLNLMVQEGMITQAQANEAYAMPLSFSAQEVSLVAPHFAVYVRQQLEEQFGAQVVANGGLRVTTTLDLDWQQLAERLARQHVAALRDAHHLSNAALVALKPGSGEILAMLGSVDYHDEDIEGQVNVTLTPQQPGSAIKPITYAAALSPATVEGEPAWTAADLLWDVPAKYPQFDGTVYEPVNYDGRFHGPVRLRQALANSYNVPAILLLQDIGIPRFLDLARQMGITSLSPNASDYGLSLTLGGGDVTPLELTAAYAVLANGGFRVPPVSILKVENSRGELLYQATPPPPQPVLDPRVAFLISDILDDDAARVPAMGLNNPLALPFPAAVKTGTTNDFRDNWTVGYTPGLVVGVWAGNTDNSQMVDVSGLTGAAPLWSDFMRAVYADPALQAALAGGEAAPAQAFLPPEGLEQRPLCDLRAVTPGAEDCQRQGMEWFLASGQAPATPTPGPLAEPLVVWERVEPAVWRLPAWPLPPVPAEELVSTGSATPGEEPLPPQTMCSFSQGTLYALLPAEARPQLFLTPPRNPESLKGAYQWAQEQGLAILPAADCTEEMLAQVRDPNVPAVWRISSPRPDQEVTGVVPVLGIADFDPARVQFYKVEIDLGNEQWVTLGQTHNTPVQNGTLEMLHADALPPGEYRLRLIVVLWDGNYAGEPYLVPFQIVRP